MSEQVDIAVDLGAVPPSAAGDCNTPAVRGGRETFDRVLLFGPYADRL